MTACRALRDPDREIGDAFPVSVHFEHRRHPPQVRSDRLVQGQDLEAILLEPHFEAIGIFFFVLHVGDQLEPSLADRLHALVERLDHGGGQTEKIVPQRILLSQRVPQGPSRVVAAGRVNFLVIGTAPGHQFVSVKEREPSVQ